MLYPCSLFIHSHYAARTASLFPCICVSVCVCMSIELFNYFSCEFFLIRCLYTYIYKFPTCVRPAYVFVGMQRVYFFMPSNSVVQYNEPTLNKSNNIETTTKILHPYYTYSINQLAKWFSLRLKKTVTWKTPVVTMTELTVLSFCCYSVHPLIFCCLQACERYCNVLVLESVFVCVSISAIPKKD